MGKRQLEWHLSEGAQYYKPNVRHHGMFDALLLRIVLQSKFSLTLPLHLAQEPDFLSTPGKCILRRGWSSSSTDAVHLYKQPIHT